MNAILRMILAFHSLNPRPLTSNFWVSLRRMRSFLPLLAAASLLLAIPCRAQDPPDPFDPGGWITDEQPESRPANEPPDTSTPDYNKAVELQRHGKWRAAQKAFREMIEKFPQSKHKAMAEARSDDNCFAGCEMLHKGGPPERRIDVSVMGDGFTIDDADQDKEKKWAQLCLTVLWNEASYSEYRDYFNFYFVRLISLEEGVDPQLSEAEKAKIEERNKSRTRKKKTEFSTALDCKEAGPQKQVMADRNLVFKWLKIASRETPGCIDDRLVIAFAQFGVLGMGGGGVANVGRPDKSVTVHEFGHAFVGLLDEYAVNPMSPQEPIMAPNAATTSDRDKVPWAHFLKAKFPGVDVYKGGATYREGVWRPALGCAMNSAGHTGYCPVCREACILKIYSYVSPIDACEPSTTQEVIVTANSDKVVSVTPMKPMKHDLKVAWYVEPIANEVAMPEPTEPLRTGSDPRDLRQRLHDLLGGQLGKRASEDRAAFGSAPPGNKDAMGTTRKSKDGTRIEDVFPLGRLKPGRYRITAEVWDSTPWVLLDSKHLLEERKTWFVKVVAPSATVK